MILNLVRLKPGEALYLPAGELHSYLEGVGIELMANSDNVLRGGLTTKHIDVEELLNVLTFEATDIEILTPTKTPSGEMIYPTPAKEFRLTSVILKKGESFTSRKNHSVEILICTAGAANIETLSDGGILNLGQGESVLIPAAANQYRLSGEATLFRADVPF
jgi:mannose-6-phosphate isomerase